MNADKQDNGFKYKELTAKIIGIFYKVYSKLGYGFLEKVSENNRRLEGRYLIIAEKRILIICENLRPKQSIFHRELIRNYLH
ncbi:GxxExxY protein [candidate division WOR-3 bacterium]|nr:GxxExxY protein [candidate division WOR-3 bacterium]